ncbi:MAG: Crp/Fnr family transcriptional regulator [Chitinophagales bacterium]|nr:Crp/Fnr family transcriptional regulator [Chitinophagales bacterium]MCZ2392302.1 Crp/Fnr family transcriptional regulator [Chitinophagales bacterium]
MQIDYNILIAYGGVAKKIKKKEFVYKEGNPANFYFQVIQGEIKEFSSHPEGKMFIHAIYQSGEGFGESSILLNRPYLNSAQALSNSVIIKIGMDKFLNILSDYPDISLQLMQHQARRIDDFSSFATIGLSNHSKEKIKIFLAHYKKSQQIEGRIIIPFTRQQIAEYTCLRVETVIRTLKEMEIQKEVEIINRKLYY